MNQIQYNRILQVLQVNIVIDLSLRSAVLSTSGPATVKVRSVQLPLVGGDEKNHAAYKLMQSWIQNVTSLHSKKKAQGSTAMQVNDLEKLMAEWPVEIDHAISSNQVLRD